MTVVFDLHCSLNLQQHHLSAIASSQSIHGHSLLQMTVVFDLHYSLNLQQHHLSAIASSQLIHGPSLLQMTVVFWTSFQSLDQLLPHLAINSSLSEEGQKWHTNVSQSHSLAICYTCHISYATNLG